jgi:glycosyltransferase involved in cell wall biosynthesis
METFGGAERVTAELARLYPSAPVIAILGRQEVASRMGVADRFTTLLPPREGLLRNYRWGAPAYPLLVRARQLPEADVVTASSYAFAHGFGSANGAPLLCYSWGPLRFAWTETASYRDHWAHSGAGRMAFRALAAWIRATDRNAGRKVDKFMAPLDEVADRIKLSYGAEAEIVPPPVDTTMFMPSDRPPDDYYLFCGRLIEPYKRITVLVEAFNQLDERLVIAGDGPMRPGLEAIAGPNIEFVGELRDAALVERMQTCRAVVFPSRDDFGLVPVEVMACGRPVLAFAGGGAVNTVLPGVTGEFFELQRPEAIIEAVRGFDPSRFDPEVIRQHAFYWDARRFRERVHAAVTELVEGRRPAFSPTLPRRRSGLRRRPSG